MNHWSARYRKGRLCWDGDRSWSLNLGYDVNRPGLQAFDAVVHLAELSNARLGQIPSALAEEINQNLFWTANHGSPRWTSKRWRTYRNEVIMNFTQTPLGGAFILDVERLEDSRGFFARTWCRNECNAFDIPTEIVQCCISFNVHAGTVRGMHFQVDPHGQPKLVRCTSGSIYDVILDLRAGSATFMQWTAVELSARNHRMLYIPMGLAHGFQTLENNTEVFYQMGEFHHPESGRGYRYNDPAFKIHWPLAVTCISERDKNWPLMEESVGRKGTPSEALSL